VLLGPAGFVAVIAGWVTTEVGRQPFTVYHALRTAQSVAPIATPAISASLVAFVVVYFTAFGSGGWYILKLMAKAPQPHEPAPDRSAHGAGIASAAAVAPKAPQ
jgi:cytochrome d ubiquinol oxidase subunit I